MQKQEVTIYDVAREAKVSMATVSRVVNGNNNVRKETRDRVLKVIERLHYQPNAVAQGLASKKTTTVGLIVPDFSNLHFAELSQGINDIATLYKYNILLSSVGNTLVGDDHVIQNLLNKQVDGIIYMADQISEKGKETLLRSKIPVVLAGTLSENKETFGSVAIDYKKAVEESLEIFYQNGKRNFALVLNNPETYLSSKELIPAFNQFAQEHKLSNNHVYSDISTYEDGYNLVDQLRQDKIDAVITLKDMTAGGIINGALEKGMTIPKQLEIISAGSTNVAKLVNPQLTVVQQPLYDIGAMAMRMLTKLMNNETVEDKNIKVPYLLLRGKTTL
ncbi:substrate-binding domain-containing protein [Lactobacillus sp. PV034]|uniref:substrate-binding domain-containing protein n=1 Tax=Lactobacillus sp. PV034 TaxID=2594495 RepID=UPI00223ECD9C|nr:substrate-binding domain-containing protein [Lactobacillus sp. PV034]QNQ81478.1 LacI family DNA-binding transcriptional regulator [Lactobacillus sp. PV034]